MSSHRESLKFALRLLLRPLMRFCLKHSIKIQDISTLVKMELVGEARRELKSSQLPVSASKLAVMTGVQRADVGKYLKEQSAEPDISANTNVITRVISQWRLRKEFCDENSNPRVLDTKGKRSEFAKLVQSINKYLNPYTILFELERLGYVEHKNHKLSLKAAIHFVSENFEESFAHLGVDIDDILNAVSENTVDSGQTKNLHLRTAFDNVSTDSIDEIKSWLLDKGTEYHREVSDYLANFDKDTNPELQNKEGGARIAFTTFSISGFDK